MGRLSDLLDSLATGTRGFGEGATLGVIKYPQAALMTAVNGGDYTQNLHDLRQQNQQLAQQDPVAWYGGELGGGVALGALTGGYGAAPGVLGKGGQVLNLVRAGSKAKVLNPIVTNAAMGAVSGATQNDYTTPTQMLKDIGTGAAVAGTIAGLGESARVAIKKIGSHWVASEAVPFLQQTGTPGATPRAVVQGLKQIPAGEVASKPFIGSTQVLKNIAIDTAKDAGYGAAVGAGGAALLGQDPLTGAMVGAGGSMAFGKKEAVKDLMDRGGRAAAALIARNPLAVSNPVRTAYYTAGPELAAAATSRTTPDLTNQDQPIDWLQYSTPQTTTPTVAEPQQAEKIDWSQYTTK